MTEVRMKWIREQARFQGIFDRDVYPLGMLGKRISLSSALVYDEEKAFIGQALESGLDGGQRAQFEKELAEYLGMRYAVGLSSGQAALDLALRLAGERLYGSASGILAPEGLGRGGALQGKRVFCSDLTTAEMVSPIVYEGGVPVFIDSADGTDWSMDPEVLELAFVKYPDVKIVIMNHVYGVPGQVMRIKQICREHGALLIEWAGEALGAECRAGDTGEQDMKIGNKCQIDLDEEAGSRSQIHQAGAASVLYPVEEGEEDRSGNIWMKAGSLGDYCVLGFGGDSMIGRSGGVLLTRDYYSSEKTRYWASGARAATLWNQHEELGSSCLMDELVAASLRGQLLHLGEIIEKKKKIYERYLERLDGAMASVIPVPEGTRSSYCITAMTCESNLQFMETRDGRKYTYEDIHGTAAPMEIWEALEAFNAESRPVYKPMSMQPAFCGYEHFTLDGPWRMYENLRKDTFWVRSDMAKQYYECGICLPSDVGMTKEEQERIMEVVCACYDGAVIFAPENLKVFREENIHFFGN